MEKKRTNHGFAHSFYVSPAWIKCRTAYARSKANLCERCLQKGIINAGTKKHPNEVHHKIRLTPENIRDPEVALNWDNLEVLCEECHKKEHRTQKWRTDPDGHVEL